MRCAGTCSARPNAPLRGVAMAGRGPDRAGGRRGRSTARRPSDRRALGPWLGCWELEPQAADEVPVPAIRTCVTRTASDPGSASRRLSRAPHCRGDVRGRRRRVADRGRSLPRDAPRQVVPNRAPSVQPCADRVHRVASVHGVSPCDHRGRYVARHPGNHARGARGRACEACPAHPGKRAPRRPRLPDSHRLLPRRCEGGQPVCDAARPRGRTRRRRTRASS